MIIKPLNFVSYPGYEESSFLHFLQSYISKALYFAPLLGSNKNNSNNVQYLILN